MARSGQNNSKLASELPDGLIQQQLGRILSSEQFSDAPRLKRFLEYIVTETVAGNETRLKGYTLGLEVFDRAEDFDPQIDTIVRVQAGQLRRRLDLFYANEGQDDLLRISVPKGKYAPTFHFESPARTQEAPTSNTAHSSDAAQPSIAVLPFDNFSGNSDDQYFADGLTEEIIANLARFKDLFVFSRSTTAKLTRDGADIRQLRDEIGVDFVVEGSVRKAPTRVRVTVQLIDATSDGHILSEQFERPCTVEGIFEIQDEIALLIAGRIAHRYGPLGRYAARAGRTGQSKIWETYDWITKFYGYYGTGDPTKHSEVRDGLPSALEKDPNSSDGWAALSIILLDEYRFHMNERHVVPVLEHALDHAKKAVAIDPENAFAHQALAMVEFHRGEDVRFRMAAERALELNPGHSDVLADMGMCYAVLGDWERGIELANRAIELSPVHPGWYHIPGALYHFVSGDTEAAILELREAPMPGFYWHHALLACFFAETGETERAQREVGEVLASYPGFAEAAHDELKIWSIHATLAQQVLSGWRKAGLPIPDSPR